MAAMVLAVVMARTPAESQSRAAAEVQVPAAEAGSPDEPTVRTKRIELIAVSEEDPWMAAVAAPLAGRLQSGGQSAHFPLLIAISSPPTREAEQVIQRAAPKRTLLLTAVAEPKLGRLLPKLSPEVLAIGSDPVRGSLLVAKRFWKQPRQAVLAASDDSEGIIFGSALAARMSIPLLIRRRSEPRDSLAGVLEDLGVKEALAAVADAERAPGWVKSRKYKVEVVGPRAVQGRLIELVGAKNIHTIVVARVPDKRAAVGSTAWLAPYWSLVRGAAGVGAYGQRRSRRGRCKAND